MHKLRLVILTVSMTVIASLYLAAQNPSSDTPAQAPTRVAAAEQDKKITKKVNPLYPKDEFAAKITGVINLETTIGIDGKVTNVRPLSTGNANLIKAAVDAIKQWVYKPTKIGGKTVEVVTIVTINFKVGE